MRLAKFSIVAAVALSACAPLPSPYPELPAMTVRTSFGVKHLCGQGVSPPVELGRVPAAAARYTIRMTNIGVLFHTPWQETVSAAAGPVIPEGAARSYPGPCPGEVQNAIYRIEVLALDAGDRPVAYGRLDLSAISLDRKVREARSNPGRPPAMEPDDAPAEPSPRPPAPY